MKRPMIFAGVGVIINIVLNLILVQYMAHNGLALATSIAALCNMILLLAGLRWKHPNILIIQSRKKLIKLALAAIIAVGTSYLTYLYVIIPLNHLIIARVAQLILAVIVAGVVYLILLYIMKIEEVKFIRQIVRWKEYL